jgi:hypothetical protein
MGLHRVKIPTNGALGHFAYMKILVTCHLQGTRYCGMSTTKIVSYSNTSIPS